jgi:predicted nucleic acid-binding protein
MRLVLDSSVVIAAIRPDEPDHEAARAFVARLRSAQTSGAVSVFGPPELWLEAHVVEQRLANSRRGPPAVGSALDGLTIELVAPASVDAIGTFLAHLTRRMRGRRPFANATDLVYLWAAHEVSATVVTLDRGMLAYHGVVCDVTRPQHVRIGKGPSDAQ